MSPLVDGGLSSSSVAGSAIPPAMRDELQRIFAAAMQKFAESWAPVTAPPSVKSGHAVAHRAAGRARVTDRKIHEAPDGYSLVDVIREVMEILKRLESVPTGGAPPAADAKTQTFRRKFATEFGLAQKIRTSTGLVLVFICGRCVDSGGKMAGGHRVLHHACGGAYRC